MPLRFTCRNCGQDITLRFVQPGIIVPCRACGTENLVQEDAERIEDDSSRPEAPVNEQTQCPDSGLQSESIGRILSMLLLVGLALGVTLFGLVFHLKDSLSPLTHSPAGWYFVVLLLITGPVVIFQVVTFLLWLARVHYDLQRFYPGYPVSPGQAVIRLLIPVYHVWGSWNVFSTIARHLRQEPNAPDSYAPPLRNWTVVLLVTFAADYLLMIPLIGSGATSPATISYTGLFSDWEVLSFALNIVSAIVQIRMTLLVRGALKTLLSRQPAH